ncbi:hypothetical protein BABINDRAFT_138064 [Babjeviella inositovora NRRL Y-12698]|uniref:Uncharacterized protein n=1 Tax=Babjeviella inositovora NRRL Y-12698 TaxID=984486 RepID=A0A1E3QQL9_9ASCO|nr:uncharacterized protein BABINDRAFT_138064 [Babjeviella inositovora NRRL Y-12698]ODQ79979.1 hypothetical protein BABINDRAFT_138064 [Babjeviella inositovora NRRL Y-12698]
MNRNRIWRQEIRIRGRTSWYLRTEITSRTLQLGTKKSMMGEERDTLLWHLAFASSFHLHPVSVYIQLQNCRFR